MKIIIKLLVTAAIFTGTWLLLSQIDFQKIFGLKKLHKYSTETISDLINNQLKRNRDNVKDPKRLAILNKIKDRICAGAGIDGGKINVYLFDVNDINAFALPGNNLVVYTGLINDCDSVEELCGVMAHEIGHIELNHVTKRIATDVGISAIISVATNGSGELIADMVEQLSKNAFSRVQETEADNFAVESLEQASINPAAFAGFMKKIAKEQPKIMSQMEWLSTHPDSEKRAEAISKQIRNQYNKVDKVITEEEWGELKN